MQGLVETLERLNRKERFFLVGQALGNPEFELAPAFMKQIADVQGIETLPTGAVRCFMDFNLDWLYAALILASAEHHEPFHSPAFIGTESCPSIWNVNTNQEDVDLLVVYEQDAVTQLILIEAKGASSWSIGQIASKTRRLRRIFGEDGQAFDTVEPHFVIMSPKAFRGARQENGGSSRPSVSVDATRR